MFFLNSWRVAAATNTILISLALVFSAVLYARSESANDRIRHTQVEACENSLRPGGVRRVIAERIRQDIQRQQTIDYEKFFPDIPPDELEALLAEGRKRDQAQIHALLDVDCEKLYSR